MLSKLRYKLLIITVLFSYIPLAVTAQIATTTDLSPLQQTL